MGQVTTRSVFITGANGYIGFAVGQAFLRAGWKVYGLVRRSEAELKLARSEIIPILGVMEDQDNIVDQISRYTKAIDVVVGAIEVKPGHGAHYNQAVTLIRRLAKVSNEHSVRPLVLWTPGCKGYSITGVDGRRSSLKIFENKNLFDGVVLRPTNVYGYNSSHYSAWFETAEELKRSCETLHLAVNPKSISHALHVDDCAEAYVALAEHHDWDQVAGKAFNISARRYETTQKIWAALEREYDIVGQVKFGDFNEAAKGQQDPAYALIFGYSQWISSEKIRSLTGWCDKRGLFGEDIALYRKAYEANRLEDHSEKTSAMLSRFVK